MMAEIMDELQESQISLGEIVEQQRTMIEVLKSEIIRLQEENRTLLQTISNKDQMYNDSILENGVLNQKIDALKENNDSLFQTLEVFQREFVKPDYKKSMTGISWKEKPISDAPFFMELVRNMRSKFVQMPQSLQVTQRSNLSDYYGYFFHSEVEQTETELFQECQNTKKIRTSKIRSFGKKNFFNEKFRHFFWFHVSENPLKISYKLYQALVAKLDNIQHDSKMENMINLDLRRMDLKVDSEKSEAIKNQIRKCLNLFCLYRPDIGYIQGMSYISWMLVIRLDCYESFSLFCNKILCDPFIHSLYLFKQENIKRIIQFYEECLEDKRPKLAKHMKKNQVEPDLFIIEWAYTFFSRAFSLRITSKIWDLWFSEGFNAFYKTVMAIMEMLESEILEEKENDKIIQILRTKTHKINEYEFLKVLGKQKLYEDLKL